MRGVGIIAEHTTGQVDRWNADVGRVRTRSQHISLAVGSAKRQGAGGVDIDGVGRRQRCDHPVVGESQLKCAVANVSYTGVTAGTGQGQSSGPEFVQPAAAGDALADREKVGCINNVESTAVASQCDGSAGGLVGGARDLQRSTVESHTRG